MDGTFTLDENWQFLLHELGVEADDLTLKAILPANFWCRTPLHATEQEYTRFYNALAKDVGEYTLAMGLGVKMPLNVLQPSIFIAACSTNFNEGTQRLLKYKRLTSPLTLNLRIESDKTTISVLRPGRSVPVVLGMMELLTLLRLLRDGTRKQIYPLGVGVAQMPESQSMYEAYLGTRLTQSDHFEIVLSNEATQMPFLTANNQLQLYIEAGLDKRLQKLERAETTKEKVRKALYEALQTRVMSINHIANKMGVNIRTLQRSLARENTTYQNVLNETRKELACYYLQDTKLTITEIAYRLGYEESGFFRAFKQWTGYTPDSYRTQILSNEEPGITQ